MEYAYDCIPHSKAELVRKPGSAALWSRTIRHVGETLSTPRGPLPKLDFEQMADLRHDTSWNRVCKAV
jgi:hypothetical protein